MPHNALFHMGLHCLPYYSLGGHCSTKSYSLQMPVFQATHFNLPLHDTQLEITVAAKYFGVTISDDLTWNTHIYNII